MKQLSLILFFIFSFVINNNAQTQDWYFEMEREDSSGDNYMAADTAGNSFLFGPFYNTIDIDPGTGNTNITSNGSDDIFFSKYDQNGNIVESINGFDNFKMKTITIYIAGRISKIEYHSIFDDSEQLLESVTEFDKYYNPLNEKTYQDSKLKRETKNEYKFDNNGNWIEKTVSLKEHFYNSKKFVAIYIESRKIEYWE